MDDTGVVLKSPEIKKEKNYPRRIFILLSVLTLFAFLAILKATKSFSVQILLSILLALIALPAIRKLHSKFRLPWAAGIVISLAAFILLFSGLARLLQASASSIISAYPRYEKRLLALYK